MRKISLLVILAIVLLPLTACEGEMPPAGEVIDNVVEAMGEVESYRQDTDITMQLYFMAEDMPSFFPLDMDLEMNMETACDLVNNETEAIIDMKIAGADDDSLEMDFALYIVDDTMYVMMDYPIISPMWMKSDIPWMYAQQMNDHKVLMEVLQRAGIEVAGTERKEGTNCYVLEVTPDIGQILESLIGQLGVYDGGYSESDLEMIDEIFQDFSVKLWVDKNNYRITYVEVNLQMEVSPELMGEYDEEGLFSLDATIKAHYHDYNKSVKIDLPPEAENADEGSLW